MTPCAANRPAGSGLSPRRTRFGKVFYGCVNDPTCDDTAWEKPVPVTRPACKNPTMGEKTRKPRGKDPIQVLLCPKCGPGEPMGNLHVFVTNPN